MNRFTVTLALLLGVSASFAGCSGGGGAATTTVPVTAAAKNHTLAVQSLSSLGAYNVDWNNVIVAGVSSGADMATQLHFSHSSKIRGEAIFAGAPYYCAQDNASISLYQCMGTSYGPIPLATLETDTNNASAQGYIDAVSHLSGQHAWLFSGTQDSVVAQSVVKSANSMLQHYGVSTTTNFSTAAQHGWVTPDVTSACGTQNSTYLINCGFDAEQQFLSSFFGTLNARNSGTLGGQLIKFDQTPYQAPSMDSSAYVFVPSNCASGALCKLVVALHGCEQGQSYVGTAFVTKSGLNEWADTNSIIVLYPQAVPSNASYPYNPYGCWDWWGYDDTAYASQPGSQVSAIWSMIQRI